jgi:hypothetical protein
MACILNQRRYYLGSASWDMVSLSPAVPRIVLRYLKYVLDSALRISLRCLFLP